MSYPDPSTQEIAKLLKGAGPSQKEALVLAEEIVFEEIRLWGGELIPSHLASRTSPCLLNYYREERSNGLSRR